MSSAGLPVPCYWPGCGKTISHLNNLATHLKNVHGVTEFGCNLCEFKSRSEDVARSHLARVHNLNGRPPKANNVIARSYREKYISSGSVTVSRSQFHSRGGRLTPTIGSNEPGPAPRESESDPEQHLITSTPDPEEHHITSTPDEPTNVSKTGEFEISSDTDESDTATEIEKATEHDTNQPGPSPSLSRTGPVGLACFKCREIITPSTHKAMIQHLHVRHSPVIVELDFNRISHDRTTYPLARLSGGAVAPDTHDEDQLSRYGGEEYDIEVDGNSSEQDLDIKAVEERQRSPSSEDVTVPNPQQPKTGEHRLPITPDSESTTEIHLRGFMESIKPGANNEVELALGAHETREITGKKYRVHRDIAAPLAENMDGIVHAVLTPAGWHCEVPQCGALLNQEFAIDLHLHAHGTPTVIPWYCGDMSCQDDSDEVFDSKESLRHHVATHHMSSRYSYAAARRVPGEEVFVSTLWGWLKLKRMPRPIDVMPMVVQDETCDDPEQEEAAWHRFRFHEKSEEFSDVDEDDDLRGIREQTAKDKFRKRYPEGYVSLWKTPTMAPRVLPPCYLVETLSGFAQMDESEAMKFVKSCEELCSMMGTKDKGKLWPGLRMPPPKRVSIVACPWPECQSTYRKTYDMLTHFLSAHLDCVWQCWEKGCEFCCYVNPQLLERHRIHCHVGSPLQCSHNSCDQVLLQDCLSSRGHSDYVSLRKHFEHHFNLHLEHRSGAFRNQDSDLSHFGSVQEDLDQPLPDQAEYKQRFSHYSSDYLNSDRRDQIRKQNLKYSCGKHKALDVRSKKTCSGFNLRGVHFECADSVPLQLDTTLVIFVPSALVFTVARTCDYCIFVMSVLSRPRAALPLPFHFGAHSAKSKKIRKRIGIGSSVNDHQSLCQVVAENHLPLPEMAKSYKALRDSSPEKIFIVDFETVWRKEAGQPLILLEITVRNGNGNVIISCRVNERGVTNAQFESHLRQAKFTHDIIRHSRRIRGPETQQFPRGAKSAKEILSTLTKAGLSPEILWVEYSNRFFDYACMELLIKTAGLSAASLLPPRKKVWTVIPDFMRFIPGLASYRLGRIGELVTPHNQYLKSLHYSSSDTAVLYDIINCWVDKFGQTDT